MMVNSNTFTVILFFWFAWSFGYTLTGLLKIKYGDLLERNLINLGFGLASWVSIGVLMNFLHIPIRWWLFLLMSLPYPLYSLISAIKSRSLGLGKWQGVLPYATIFTIGVLVLYGGMSYVFLDGANKYPYLEDGDAYRNIAQSYHIAETGHFRWSADKPLISSVEEPYPQGYHIVIGTLLQTSTSWNWVIKTFNAIILSLGLIFFYFMVAKLSDSHAVGFFSTFCLFAIPSFMTHFIWATSLSIPLFFPAFYSLASIKDNKRWLYVGGIAIFAIMVTQFTNAVFFGLFFMFFLFIQLIFNRQLFKFALVSGIIGVVLAATLFYIPAFIRNPRDFGVSGESGPFVSGAHAGGEYIYSIKDFLSTPPYGKIDNSIGVGWMLSLIFLLGLGFMFYHFFKSKKSWKPLVVGWFFIGFLGVMAGRLPYSLYPHRAWSIMSIPLCIIAGYGFVHIWRWLRPRFNPILVISILMLIILSTSGYSKYRINTAVWGWGAGIPATPETMQGYVFLKQLPSDARVFPVCSNIYLPVAFNKPINWWDEDIFYRSYTTHRLNEVHLERYESTPKLTHKSPEEAHLWLKMNDFRYVIIDLNCVSELGAEQFGETFNMWLQSGRFTKEFDNGVAFVFGVV